MLKEYLKTSPIAETVQLEGNVILHRQKMSAEELMKIEGEGEFPLVQSRVNEGELEVNGQTVATGKIIKIRGEYYFKVVEMNRGDEK